MQRTVIVVGLARSGTSIVAGLLHHLGCGMNPYDNVSKMLPRGGFEDKFLQRWCMVSSKNGITQARRDDLLKYIKIRNSDDLWGFKNAAMAKIIPKMVEHFRNPYIVWVWRDLMDGARSSMAMTRFIGRTPLKFWPTVAHRARHLTIMARASGALEGTEHMHIKFSSIKDNPLGAAEKLSAIVGGDPAAALDAVYVKNYRSWDEA